MECEGEQLILPLSRHIALALSPNIAIFQVSWNISSLFREYPIYKKSIDNSIMTIHESFFKNWLKLTFYWLLHQPEIQRQESQLGRSEKCNESISWLSSVFTFSATFTATFIRLWRFTSSFCCFFLNSSFLRLLFPCFVPLFITRIASGITTRSCFGHSFYKL